MSSIKDYKTAHNEVIIEKTDNVNHPAHYVGKIEVIDYLEDKLTNEQFEGYLVGNVLKYLSRYKKKNGLEDLKKGQWYLNKLVEFKNEKEEV